MSTRVVPGSSFDGGVVDPIPRPAPPEETQKRELRDPILELLCTLEPKNPEVQRERDILIGKRIEANKLAQALIESEMALTRAGSIEGGGARSSEKNRRPGQEDRRSASGPEHEERYCRPHDGRVSHSYGGPQAIEPLCDARRDRGSRCSGPKVGERRRSRDRERIGPPTDYESSVARGTHAPHEGARYTRGERIGAGRGPQRGKLHKQFGHRRPRASAAVSLPSVNETPGGKVLGNQEVSLLSKPGGRARARLPWKRNA